MKKRVRKKAIQAAHLRAVSGIDEEDPEQLAPPDRCVEISMSELRTASGELGSFGEKEVEAINAAGSASFQQRLSLQFLISLVKGSPPSIARTALPSQTELAIDERSNFGYNIARMRYDIIFAPEAVDDFRALSASELSTIRDAIEKLLRHEPDKLSKSRIKRLRGITHPQYRLRVGDIRVFYDIDGHNVEILSIVPKSEAAGWLGSIGGEDR